MSRFTQHVDRAFEPLLGRGILRRTWSQSHAYATTVIFDARSFRLRLVQDFRDGEHAEIASTQDPERWSAIDWAIRAVRDEPPVHPQPRSPDEVATLVAENLEALEHGFQQPDYAQTVRKLDSIIEWVIRRWTPEAGRDE